MTSATRSVAVVATRLPNIDRRALSQAWFSALHLAAPAAPASVRSASAPPAKAGHPAATHPPRGARPAAPAAGAIARPAGRVCTGSPEAVYGERRGGASDLTRRIERAIVRHASRVPAARQAAVAVDAGGGRVHVVIRTDGATTRIVALCAPHLRERVDRALAQARFALAASGLRLEVTP